MNRYLLQDPSRSAAFRSVGLISPSHQPVSSARLFGPSLRSAFCRPFARISSSRVVYSLSADCFVIRFFFSWVVIRRIFHPSSLDRDIQKSPTVFCNAFSLSLHTVKSLGVQRRLRGISRKELRTIFARTASRILEGK